MRKLHRWLAIPAAVFLLVASFTGLWLEVDRFFGAEEAERESLRDIRSSVTAPTFMEQFGRRMNAVTAAAAAVAGPQPLDEVVWKMKGPHPSAAFVFGPTEGGEGRRVVVDLRTATVVSVADYEEQSFILRLHSGEVLGDGGKVVGMFWGVALLVLTITGLAIYLRMRPRSKRLGWRRFVWVFPAVIVASQLIP